MGTVWDKLVKGGAAVLGAIFGWWAGLGVLPQTLVVFMSVDYATGLLCAWRGVSPKTDSGMISSRAGFDGLLRKACIVLVVLVAGWADKAVGTSVLAAATMSFYIANEGISILENTTLMGVPWPQVLKDALEAMRKRGDGNAEDEDEDGGGLPPAMG